jgi:general secretion pathway protein D
MSIVDRLDIRRAQVLVEAILVELSADKAMDLGVNWAVASDGSSNLPAGGWLAPVKGVGLGEIISALTGNNSGDGGSTWDAPTFLPGQTSRTITVQTSGDTLNELDETFKVRFVRGLGVVLDSKRYGPGADWFGAHCSERTFGHAGFRCAGA